MYYWSETLHKLFSYSPLPTIQSVLLLGELFCFYLLVFWVIMAQKQHHFTRTFCFKPRIPHKLVAASVINWFSFLRKSFISTSWTVVRESPEFCCVFLLLLVSQIQTENVSRISWAWGDLSCSWNTSMLNLLPFAHLDFSLCLPSTEIGCAPVSVPVPLTTRSRWGRCWASTWSSRRATADERTSGASVQVSSRPAAMILRAASEIVPSLTLPKFNSKAFGYLLGWNNVPRAFWFFTLHTAEVVSHFGNQPYSLTGSSHHRLPEPTDALL